MYLKLTRADVFADLGSAGGKTCVQVMLQTQCLESIGVELYKARHDSGVSALKLIKSCPAALDVVCSKSRLGNGEFGSMGTRSMLLFQRRALFPGRTTKITLINSDFCVEKKRLAHATVVYMANFCFDPPLMRKISGLLLDMPKLRAVVCMRSLAPHTSALRSGRMRLGQVDPYSQFATRFEEMQDAPATCSASWKGDAADAVVPLFVYARRASE